MRFAALAATLLFAGCGTGIHAPAQPLPPATPPPVMPPPPQRPLLQAVVYGSVREPAGNRPAAFALVTATDCTGLQAPARIFADERGAYEITLEAGTGPDVVRCIAVQASHGGSRHEAVLPNVTFRTAPPRERYRADFDLPPAPPLTLREAERQIDSFVRLLNHQYEGEEELSTLVYGGPEALRIAREDYQSLLGNDITATITASEFAPTQQRVTAELRGSRGSGLTLSVYQEDGTLRLYSPLLYNSLRSRMFIASLSRLISARDAERLARLLTADDIDYPVEDARRLIEEHAPEFEAMGGSFELIAVDERTSTLTYRLTWRGEREKTAEADLGYGDGLLWLKQLRER